MYRGQKKPDFDIRNWWRSECRCCGGGKLWDCPSKGQRTRRWDCRAAHGYCAWCAEWELGRASSVVASSLVVGEEGFGPRVGKWEEEKVVAASQRPEGAESSHSRRGGSRREQEGATRGRERSEAGTLRVVVRGRCDHDDRQGGKERRRRKLPGAQRGNFNPMAEQDQHHTQDKNQAAFSSPVAFNDTCQEDKRI